jgi:hypothetical protein
MAGKNWRQLYCQEVKKNLPLVFFIHLEGVLCVVELEVGRRVPSRVVYRFEMRFTWWRHGEKIPPYNGRSQILSEIVFKNSGGLNK